ncbi:Bug family tripartite tricarboxylate transporter substrate binding protein [Muricoccus aerilatus]|uniref:Bug family tripartite tricarboxylate transporter substrate binding protein n=1 Tax=Muricoccus aerilatus TaxID=452982 RepID=UPI000B3138F8|nr:tripartite tricarboxylate transporter substrate-binding protein [Roseomonas aerilata]
MRRRTLLAATSVLAARPTLAQSWPTQPIRLVVPYAAGGPTDVAARLLAEALSASLSHRVIVENRTGAGTVVGTGAVANGSRDGHTFLVATVAHVVNPVLVANLAFDPIADFGGAALMGTVPQVVLVNRDLPVRSLPELLALFRGRPGGFAYGSAGNGSAQHLAAELLKRQAGLDVVHVPYRGAAPAVADMLAGQVAMVIDSAATAIPMARSGQARALAVTAPAHLSQLPKVPSVAETLPGYEAYTWNALLARAGTPPEAIARMNGAVNNALAKLELRGGWRSWVSPWYQTAPHHRLTPSFVPRPTSGRGYCGRPG